MEYYVEGEKINNEEFNDEVALDKCNQCDYQAARQDSLRAHEQSKHDGVRYSCDKCDFTIQAKTSSRVSA